MVAAFLFARVGIGAPMVTFDPPVVVPLGGVGGDVTTADIDADGDVDIITTTRDPFFFYVSINNGSGSFAPIVPFPAGDRPRAVVAADFNNDGDIDIATANELSGNIGVMVGDGAGGFAAPMFFTTISNVTDLAFEDFNGDGLLDIAVSHKNSNTGPLMVLINSGGVGAGWLGFAPAVSYAIGGGARSVEAVDVDADGLIDLITTNRNNANISVLIGNGDGTFNPQMLFPIAIQPRESITRDYNGDGFPDVAVADFFLGSVWTLVNLGRDANGWLGLELHGAYSGGGDSSHGIASGDLDLDGDLDLVIANVGSGDVSIMINNGAGAFVGTVEAVDALSAAAVAIDDLNGDGVLDVVNVNAAAAGSFSVLMNATPICFADINNDGVVDTADLGSMISVFGTPGGAADINGDGVVDTADLGVLIAGFGPCPL